MACFAIEFGIPGIEAVNEFGRAFEVTHVLDECVETFDVGLCGLGNRIADEGEEIDDALEADAAEDGAAGDGGSEPLERLGELLGNESGAGLEDDLVTLLVIECFPVGDFVAI